MPDYAFDKQPVEIEGMVWFPSDKKPYSENSSQDSFQVITMTWNQYLYWDTLFAKHNNTTYLPFGSETKVPLRAEYKRVAEPFFIKVHEVTNQEYLEFLHDITPNEVDFLSELGYPENLDMNFLPDTSRWGSGFWIELQSTFNVQLLQTSKIQRVSSGVCKLLSGTWLLPLGYQEIE
jgi:formylglycine-generating enzyme required for sulfatase activity